MTRFRAFIVAIACAGTAHATTIIPTEPVKLTRAERKTLEKMACQKPHNVPAVEISGWRLVIAKPNTARASVVCAPDLITEGYSANYFVSCSRRWSTWKCDSPSRNLRLRYLESGPYDVFLYQVEPAEAINALQCLETGLRARPDLTAGEMKIEPWSVAIYDFNGIPSYSVSFATPKGRCLTVQYPTACVATSGVQLEVATDECIEG